MHIQRQCVAPEHISFNAYSDNRAVYATESKKESFQMPIQYSKPNAESSRLAFDNIYYPSHFYLVSREFSEVLHKTSWPAIG